MSEPTTDFEELLKAAKREFILKVSVPVTSQEDQLLVERAKSAARDSFLHGWHQLAALGRGTNGREFDGVQYDFPVSMHIHAEIDAAMKADRAGIELAVLVTVHHKRIEEGGEVHVVSSCGSCLDELFHLFPNLQVIIYSGGELRKIPLQALLLIPYKRRIPNNNGSAVHEFPK